VAGSYQRTGAARDAAARGRAGLRRRQPGGDSHLAPLPAGHQRSRRSGDDHERAAGGVATQSRAVGARGSGGTGRLHPVGGGLLSPRLSVPGSSALGRVTEMAVRPWLLLHGEETFLVERALALLRKPEGKGSAARAACIVWGDDGAERIAAALDDLVEP